MMIERGYRKRKKIISFVPYIGKKFVVYVVVDFGFAKLFFNH